MKDFHVTVRVGNNHLRQRREELGMTQAELARRLGVPLSRYNAYEAMRESPLDKSGGWKESALRVARFHGVSPDELWPPAVLRVEHPVARRKVSAQEMALMLTGASTPEDSVLGGERLERLRGAVAALPENEAYVLRKRFGLDNGEGHTLAEVAADAGKSRARIHQIEARALRSLRSRLAEDASYDVEASSLREIAREMYRRGAAPWEIAHRLGIKKSTVQRLLG